MFVTRYTKQFLLAAIGIVVASLGILATLGLPLGIDFTGGALTEVSYTERPEKVQAEMALESIGLGNYSLRETIDETGRDGYILRSRDLTEEERIAVDEALHHIGQGGEVIRFTSIGPVIGEELKQKAIWAIGAVVLIIVFYVAYAFSGVSKPVSSWRYGGITILALLHDVLVPTAVFSVLAYFTGAEVDVLFVMALLAVLGYSVNDTIVVFDRVRENLVKHRIEKRRKVEVVGGMQKEEIEYSFTKPFKEIVGESVEQTLTRSINTSVTTFLALAALFVLGGDVTQNFALMLIAGVVAGTYSSICIANPLLIFFAEKAIASEAKEEDKK